MVKWLRIALLSMGTGAGLLVLLLVGGVSYLKTPQAQERIQHQIDRVLPGSVSWRRLGFSVLSGRIELDDLLIEGPAGERLAGLTHGRIDISWRSVLKGRVGVDEVIVRHPWADLAVDETGRLNLMRAFPEPSPPEPPPGDASAGRTVDVSIALFRLIDGAVSYRDPNAGLAVTLDGISAGVDAFLLSKPTGSLRLGIGRGSIESPVFTGPVEALQFTAHLDADRLAPIDLRLAAGNTEIKLAGTIDRLGADPVIDITLDADLALAEIRHLLQLAPELTGNAGLHVSATGLLADPEARVKLGYDGGLLGGFPIERIALGLHLADRKLRIDPLSVESRFGSSDARGDIDFKKAFPEGFLSSNRALNAIDYRFALRQKGLLLEKAFSRDAAYAGRLDADITFEGQGVTPGDILARCRAALSGTGILAPGMDRPVDVAAAFRGGIEGHEAVVEAITIDAGGARLSGEGRYDIADGGLNGDLSLTASDLSTVTAPAGIADVRGALSAKVSVAGSLAGPTATIDAGGKQLSLADLTLGDIRLEARLNDAGTLEIRALTLANQGSRATARGRIDLLKKGPKNTMTVRPDLPVDLTLTLESVEPADFMKVKSLEGQIDGTVTVRGPVRAPDMQAEISGKELSVGGTRIGGVEARVRMTDGSILLSPVTVVNGKSRAAISGTVDLMMPGNGAFRADPAIDIRVAGEPVFLEDFIDGMSGAMTLNGEIGGSISRPRGRAAVTGKKLDLGGQAIDEVALAARMDGGSIVVDRFQVAVTQKETFDGGGSIDLERSAYDLRLSSTGVSFANIDALAGIDGLNGKAALDISGRGTFSDPRAEGRVSVTGIRVNQEPVADIRLNLTVKDQTARAWGRGGFDLDGRYHLKKKEFSASMGFDRTDLAPYFKIAGLGDLGGRIDGTVTADGRSDAPDKIRIAADLRNLTLRSEGREFLTSPRIFARMENRAFTVADTEIRLLKEGRITLGGQGNLAGTISMTVDGRIPLSVVQPFLEDESDARGTIIVDAGLGGTLEKPEISGAVTLDRIGILLPGISQRLHDVTGRIVMSSEALVLEKIDGHMDGGSFTLGGRVDLENFKPVRMDLQAAARKLPIEVPDTLSLVLDSTLSLSGTVEKSLLKGEIVLLEGRYTKDVELRPIRGITEKSRELAPEPPAGESPLLANMGLGIVIKRRAAFEVENNLADMRLSPDLRIMGTAARPVVSGRARVDEGVITYQAIRFQRAELGFRTTEFEIRKGVVDFLNPYKTEPTIDIESEASVRDWTITLKISGTPDNLNFKLSSVPSEEDADILSLLLVGKTLKEMRQDDASGLSARQMLGDILADSVATGVKDATGLDIVELEYQEAADPDERDDVKVTLGKELSRRITVKYGAELKQGETVQKVISEYKILEALLVSAFQDTAGNFGGALTYRVEFW